MFIGVPRNKYFSPHVEKMIRMYAQGPDFLLNSSMYDLGGLCRVIVMSESYWRVKGTRHRVCELITDMGVLQPASFLDGFYPDVPKSFIDSVLAFFMLHPQHVDADHRRFFNAPLDFRVYRRL